MAAQAVSSGVGASGAAAGDTAFDLAVAGPNRCLRRFVGTTAGKDLVVEATWYDGRSTAQPKLKLWLHNNSDSPEAITGPHNTCVPGAPQTVKVSARGEQAWVLIPVHVSDACYDVTVRTDCDASWAQRFTGHLQTAKPSTRDWSAKPRAGHARRAPDREQIAIGLRFERNPVAELLRRRRWPASPAPWSVRPVCRAS